MFLQTDEDLLPPGWKERAQRVFRVIGNIRNIIYGYPFGMCVEERFAFLQFFLRYMNAQDLSIEERIYSERMLRIISTICDFETIEKTEEEIILWREKQASLLIQSREFIIHMLQEWGYKKKLI